MRILQSHIVGGIKKNHRRQKEGGTGLGEDSVWGKGRQDQEWVEIGKNSRGSGG